MRLLKLHIKQIKIHKESWTYLEEYSGQKGKMLNEMWVSFRARLAVLEDFISDWRLKLKQRPDDAVYRYITEQLNLFQRIWPILHFVTGELFETEHWKILFLKLKFPRSVTLAKLTFGHFVRSTSGFTSCGRTFAFERPRAAPPRRPSSSLTPTACFSVCRSLRRAPKGAT